MSEIIQYQQSKDHCEVRDIIKKRFIKGGYGDNESCDSNCDQSDSRDRAHGDWSRPITPRKSPRQNLSRPIRRNRAQSAWRLKMGNQQSLRSNANLSKEPNHLKEYVYLLPMRGKANFRRLTGWDGLDVFFRRPEFLDVLE